MAEPSHGSLPAIAVRHVNKTFRIPEEQVHTLKERVLHPRRRTRHQTFRVLDDISFLVEEGEFFGIAGRNGSGKSTLLKCIAGIYKCEGDIWQRGRLSTLIELGVGFNMELAARDNVITNGIMMGLSPREARKRFDSVVEFAGLEEFKDLKLKNYSSGMLVRLAFSVAIQVDADVLLIDEVLAVGDAAFQQKCFDVFRTMREEGKTIVFVTHDMGALQRFCHRALLLERGSLVHIGPPHEVADRYLEINFARDRRPLAETEGDDTGDARVLDVWVEDEEGARLHVAPQGQRITLRALVRFNIDVEDPEAGVHIHNEDQKAVLVAATWMEHPHTGRFTAGEQVVFSFTFQNVLAPGRYSPVLALGHRRSVVMNVTDRFERGWAFLVTAGRALGGIVDLPTETAIERTSSSVAEEVKR